MNVIICKFDGIMFCKYWLLFFLFRYIAARSMILVMYLQTTAAIRSVFSKASDLPITLERLNSTTYVYATIKRQSARRPSYWMFNFLYFSGKSIRFLFFKNQPIHSRRSRQASSSKSILW